MRLAKGLCRTSVVLLLPLLILETVGSYPALARSQEQPQTPSVEALIERAESAFQRGEEALAKGQPQEARTLFDQAVDTILLSGINLRSNTRLMAYYRDLLDRIHKHEANPNDQHAEEERAEVAEPAVLDQLADIKESELATVMPDGLKVFGKYDFEFSVAAPVFQFVDFFAAGRGRSTMEAGIRRSGRYRATVEKIFKEEGVPLDLMWLAQAESGWRPNALSRAAAKGIWQFVPSTGIRFDLQQSAWIDQRSQPEKSTRAAAQYLRWLHDRFAGDWLLAMAAYNSGENRIDTAIARCGYADFWELHKRGLIPQETRNYVPSILAIMIVSKNQKRYGFDVKPDPALSFDTFDLPDQTDLKVVADLMSVPYETVQEMNPELRRGVSPPGERYTIRIPKGMKKQFEIAYASLPADKRVQRVLIPADEIATGYRPAYRTKVVSYRVRRGDTLASVARHSGVSVKELARLNRMSTRGELRKGQTVRIPKTVRDRRVRASRSRSRVGRYGARAATRSRFSRSSKHTRTKASRVRSSRRR